MVIVTIEPEGQTVEYTKLNTVLQLLNKQGLHHTDTLVIRNGELITPDERIFQGDEIELRKVISVG
ncbi:MoaD/ThiS family protein [Desulfovibrio sp. JC010]|uniref:MoaD/ThiS family protein n=1 Tax=Desulfovibrio sp. JC010 TaxID=2593641 RepID=UPI0013D417D9|nr:MoaD/ThiS family protein [Desulfovibrio sp. JC010]NDV25053.1 MoaD/ThiS family protein [Desulfovibrio sp. JC010]